MIVKHFKLYKYVKLKHIHTPVTLINYRFKNFFKKSNTNNNACTMVIFYIYVFIRL